MMLNAYTFTIDPLLTPWRGDTRRNRQPYVTLLNTTYEHALWVKHELDKRGIICSIDIHDKKSHRHD